MKTLDRLLTVDDLAAHLDVPAATIYAWRCRWADRPPEVLAIKGWRHLGCGRDNQGDAWLARTAATEAAEARMFAREARLAGRGL